MQRIRAPKFCKQDRFRASKRDGGTIKIRKGQKKIKIDPKKI